MGTINVIKAVKLVHLSTVVMIKMGNFYHVYGKDAYVMSYLLNYKLNIKEDLYFYFFSELFYYIILNS